jgi:hypothetical protein
MYFSIYGSTYIFRFNISKKQENFNKNKKTFNNFALHFSNYNEIILKWGLIYIQDEMVKVQMILSDNFVCA